MNDTAQQVKEKLDIVDFLKQYMEVKPAGKNFKANCPFHKEKTPSFMISPERQTWHCFGSCSEGGDIIKFLMKYENLEFYDALKILAEKAGIEIRQSGDKDFRAHNILYSIMGSAKDFFKNSLKSSEKVKNYLKERGLKNETIEEFELGLAPDEPDLMTRHLLGLGYNITDLEKAGLILKTERGTYWDRYRGRLIFPIFNHVGKVVGFAGRVLPGAREDIAKYVNSPETPIYQKSRILYGFHKTKNDVREEKTAVLVEGYMDFLMAWQDGVKNIVAVSGTALTAEHLKALRRLADEVVLAFDADEAGQAAAERSIDASAAFDFTVKVLVIEDDKFKDPADVAKDKPGFLKELVKNAKPAMDYYFYKYFTNRFFTENQGIKEKKQNIRVLLSKIKKISSPVERQHWIKELATLTYLDEKVLAEEMGSIKEDESQEAEASTGTENISKIILRKDLIAQRLLGIALNGTNEEFKKQLEKEIEYLPEHYRDILSGNKKADLEDIMGLIGLRFSMENADIAEQELKREFQALLIELKMEYLKEEQKKSRELMHKLDEKGDKEAYEKETKRFDSISREIHNLKR
ncbi:MAG: DNA primase [Candidatus Pacebacteria bacterium]|nr:DNA primase [Candidatus Paceibacterota bacterium]